MKISFELPEKASFLLNKQARYKVGKGGRAGLKSHSFAKALLTRAAQRKTRILCTREYQVSIQDSVMQLLKDKITEAGADSEFEVGQSYITCPRTGSDFLFYGLKTNINKIKSLEGVDICWVEEAAKVSKNSWETLDPTIRKAGSEIWVTYNPEDESDPTSEMFDETSAKKVDDAIIVNFSWQDADELGWFSDVSRMRKDYDYRVDPENADHIWGGKFKMVSAAQIFKGKYKVMAFETPHTSELLRKNEIQDWFGPYYGADFGFSSDPSTLVKLWAKNGRLYIEYAAWGLGIELNDMGKFYDQVPGSRQHVIRGDNSRPETISHIRRLGFNIVAAEKWPGSVEDGIEFLKSFVEIIIHPRCVEHIEEARNYKFKEDKVTGDILPIIVDKHNHCWDADRYALQPAIKDEAEDIVDLTNIVPRTIFPAERLSL